MKIFCRSRCAVVWKSGRSGVKLSSGCDVVWRWVESEVINHENKNGVLYRYCQLCIYSWCPVWQVPPDSPCWPVTVAPQTKSELQDRAGAGEAGAGEQVPAPPAGQQPQHAVRVQVNIFFCSLFTFPTFRPSIHTVINSNEYESQFAHLFSCWYMEYFAELWSSGAASHRGVHA